MASPRLLYCTLSEHFLFRWSRGTLELEAQFPADAEGLAAFRELLLKRKRALFYLLADLSGEDFHEEQIPYLRGRDRQAVIQRRIAQRYRDTRLATALSLGVVSGERRNERMLLASFTNSQQISPWVDAIADAGIKLAGVYSAPLLAPALAARLGGRGGSCLVVTVNRAGLRQSFLEDGKLRFSRLERIASMDAVALAMLIRTETVRLAQYLQTMRALPREGPPIQAIVVAPRGMLDEFERTLVSDTRLAFKCAEFEQALRAAGVKRAPADSGGEQLYLQLAVTRPPKEQFARREDRRGYFLWRLQHAIVALGVAGFAACALYAGALWLDLANLRELTEIQRRDAALATREYERITAAFPSTQTSTGNLRATVVEFLAIASRTSSPEASLKYLARVLDRFPQITLEQVVWRIERAGEGSAAKPAPAAPATPPGAPAAGPPAGEAAQVLEISGRVNAIQRSDYRAITTEVQRFADALLADPAYRIVRTQLPFDMSPEGTLTGTSGQSDQGDAPRFSIALARKVP